MTAPAKLKGAAIADEVAAKHRMAVTDITGPSRVKAVFWARAELAYRLRMELQWSFPRIGRLLNRDHTTALYQVRQYAKKIEAAHVNNPH